MELNLHKTFGSIHGYDGRRFTEQLLQITEHTTTREASIEWANKLRFVTPPQCKSRGVAEERKSNDDNDSVYLHHPEVEPNCACQQRAKFEKTEYPYLSLTEPGEVMNCFHYVAVSYCWQQMKVGHTAGPTSIPPPLATRRSDRIRKRLKTEATSLQAEAGTESCCYDIETSSGLREGRAPRHILDRAICYAAHRGIKFIWIDQECIEQEDEVDKELGIQAMDLVYRRSHYPLGLLETVITRPAEVRYLTNACMWSGQPSLKWTFKLASLLGRDRWLQRAWICQEMIVSDSRMVCLLKYGTAFSHQAPGAFGCLGGELQIDAADLNMIGDFLHHCLDEIGRNTKTRRPEGWRKMSERLGHRLMVGSYLKTVNFYEYRVCSPVTAINLLQEYSNERVADRLAIVANLCDYPVRLNTTRLSDFGFDYCTSLMTLMLLNGDISYFAERGLKGLEYNQRQDSVDVDNQSGWQGFTWAPSASMKLLWDISSAGPWSARLERLLSAPPLLLEDSRFDHHGLGMNGWLWDLSHFVNTEAFLEEHQDFHARSRSSYDKAVSRVEDVLKFLRFFLRAEHHPAFEFLCHRLMRDIEEAGKGFFENTRLCLPFADESLPWASLNGKKVRLSDDSMCWWDYFLYLVVDAGFYWGRLTGSNSPVDHSDDIAIYAVTVADMSRGSRILLPQMQFPKGAKHRDYLRFLQRQHLSWAVYDERPGISSGYTTCKTAGVRWGVWRVGKNPPSRYLLT